MAKVAAVLLGSLLLSFGCLTNAQHEEAIEDEDNQDEAFFESRSPVGGGVYIMEHGFISSHGNSEAALAWQPRGTLLINGESVSRGGDGLEARLSDAKEFVELRPDLPARMAKAMEENSYYTIRLYNPESPKHVVQASVPAKLLAEHFEDWHDILEVTVGSAGLPVSLSYRIRHTLGLALFEHTQVYLSEPSRSDGPRIPHFDPSTGVKGAGGGADGEPQPQQPFWRKYWWAILLVMLLVTNMPQDEPQKGGGGGGKK